MYKNMKNMWSKYYQEYEKEIITKRKVKYRELKQSFPYQTNDFLAEKLYKYLRELRQSHLKFKSGEGGRVFHCLFKIDLIDNFHVFAIALNSGKNRSTDFILTNDEIEGFFNEHVEEILDKHLKKIDTFPKNLVDQEYNDREFIHKATKEQIIEFLIYHEVLDSYINYLKVKDFIHSLSPLESIKARVQENIS